MQAWTFKILTFGCKVNQYESQALAEAFSQQGGQEVEGQAQVVVLNSCAITAQAVADVRQAIAKLQRQQNGQIILTGCASSLVAKTDELGELPGVIVVPQMHKVELLKHLQTWLNSQQYQPEQSQLQPEQQQLQPGQQQYQPGQQIKPPQQSKTEELSLSSSGIPLRAHEPAKFANDLSDFKISGFKRARPIIKVQDGCTQACAYCIVPRARHQLYSRSPEEVLQEAQRLLAAGFREIMISGINLRQYQHDAVNFWDLMLFLEQNLSSWQGQARLRISSLDPAMLTAQGLEVLGASQLICRHLHLSIQSGSAAVLQGMRRTHYQPQQIIASLKQLQTLWPHFGLGADFLLGFPGETISQVQETQDFIQALPFSYAHVFPFSSRPGTIAASLKQQVPKPERQQRAKQIRNLLALKQQEFLHKTCQLPSLQVALDVGNPLKSRGMQGVDEYYNACKLTVAKFTLNPSHELLKMLPVGVSNNTLLVQSDPPALSL